MKKLLTSISLFGSIILVALTFAGVAQATFRVVQTPTLYLYSGQSASAVTMRITPYPKDLDGTKLTMTDLGSTPTVTVDPKISGYEEIESFTGITDNGDNTATLTGLSRNLTSKYPYTTAGTGKTHGAGAVVVFGNNPQIYGRLMNLEDAQTVAGNITFSGQTTFTNFPISPNSSTSSESVAGVVEIATKAEAMASTQNGSVGRLALPASMATSTYNVNSATGTILMTDATGKIDNHFLGTSTVTLYATTTVNGGLTVTGVGSTTAALTLTQGTSNVASSSVTLFTSSGTWTKPGNLKYITLRVVGGGGAGSGENSTAAGAAPGGGGGGYCENIVPAAALTSTVTVTVGTGGTGVSQATGNSGGTSSFGSWCSGGGGSGGNFSGVGNAGDGGNGGSGSNGYINIPGEQGGPGAGTNGIATGYGGDSQMGKGAAASRGTSGQTGKNYGGGGSGSNQAGTAGAIAGGAGADGAVMVTEYYF